MEVNVEYVSVGCACRPKSVSWSSNGLLAFAADKSIALAKHSEVKIVNCTWHMVFYTGILNTSDCEFVCIPSGCLFLLGWWSRTSGCYAPWS